MSFDGTEEWVTVTLSKLEVAWIVQGWELMERKIPVPYRSDRDRALAAILHEKIEQLKRVLKEKPDLDKTVRL